MKIEQLQWTQEGSWQLIGQGASLKNHQLVVYFGERTVLESGIAYQQLRQLYPNAVLLGCSSGGEVLGNMVFDNTVVATAFYFEATQIQFATSSIESGKNSFLIGVELAQALQKDDLCGVFIYYRMGYKSMAVTWFEALPKY